MIAKRSTDKNANDNRSKRDYQRASIVPDPRKGAFNIETRNAEIPIPQFRLRSRSSCLESKHAAVNLDRINTRVIITTQSAE